MSVPITLPSGYVLIYGRYYPSNGGVYPDNDKWRFGTIYQVWDGGQVFVYGGDEVMFNTEAVLVTLNYNNNPYQMIPARLVTKQITPP